MDFDGPLTQETLTRILAERPPAEIDLHMRPSTPTSTMSPDTAMMLGSIADGMTTYGFLKQGRASESNPLYAGLKNDPLKTGLSVAATGVGHALLAKLLKKHTPDVFRNIIDAYTAQKAAGRMNAAAEGVILPSRYVPLAPLNDYKTKMTTEMTRGSR